MSKSKLQTALDDFVQAIVGIAEDTAQDTLATRAKELGSVRHAGRKPMSAKSATAKATRKPSRMTKPCPHPACEKTGAPRLGMMCSDHKNLSKAKKNALRFRAKEPGGKWNPDGKSKKATKKKATAKKAAKRTKKATAKKSAKAPVVAKTA